MEPEARGLTLNLSAQGFARNAAHSAALYEAGAVICGKYRLDEMLGEGGMGSVWRATNLQLDCPVALKLIRGEHDRVQMRLRLQLEARAAAKLAHPSIVRVFDIGESERGDPFIVMEILNGQTLSQTSLDAPLSAVRAVQLLLPRAEARSSAHASGVVHRDLKPDNVFIVADGGRVQPKLLDFGIAKMVGSAGRDGGLTQSGTLVGTPDYMSPEGARGQSDLDARADLWSFCVVLYEQVAGMVPFVGDNPHAMLRAIIEDTPMPLPPYVEGAVELWAILQRGLAKERRDRFQSMADLGRALALWLQSQGVHEDACGLSVDAEWLRSNESSTPALLGNPQSSRGQRQRGAASKIGGRRSAGRRRNGWMIAIAASAIALCGALSSAKHARLPERSAELQAAASTAEVVVPKVSTAPPPSAPIAETPPPAAAGSVRAVARRVPSSAAPRAASRPLVASTPTGPTREARSASLELLPAY